MELRRNPNATRRHASRTPASRTQARQNRAPGRIKRTARFKRMLLGLLAVPALVVIGGHATAEAAGTIAVPAGATQAQVSAAMTTAVAAGPGTTLAFPAGKYVYNAKFTAKDGINVTGAGIWKQNAAGGGGGTWLQCKGMNWGSDLTVSKMLVGENAAGVTSTFQPVARGSSTAGADTKANGSHKVAFNFVRFKGGSDSGSPLVDLGGNFNSLWSGALHTTDMVATTFTDCEFERPQSTNATNGTSKGAILNIWLDSRRGGAQVHDLQFNRCHFGVKNGYRSGVDGYGIGRCILLQPAPAEHGADGPRPTGKADNLSFDWGRLDHGFSNVAFSDCLFEYSLWYPIDVCDYARSYSLTDRFGGVIGSNPPTAAQAAQIPDRAWAVGCNLARCYFKGASGSYHVVYEIGKNCKATACGGTSISMNSGSFGNAVSGSFAGGSRPRTSLFSSDWTGTGTSYTPSPFDP
jgi:hypothetical protein